jgi:hypothetical protein
MLVLACVRVRACVGRFVCVCQNANAAASLEKLLVFIPAAGSTTALDTSLVSTILSSAYDAFSNRALEDVNMTVSLVITRADSSTTQTPYVPTAAEAGRMCKTFPCTRTATWDPIARSYLLTYQVRVLPEPPSRCMPHCGASRERKRTVVRVPRPHHWRVGLLSSFGASYLPKGSVTQRAPGLKQVWSLCIPA